MSDPRTLWVSDDGLYAVVNASTVPLGVARGNGIDQFFTGTSAAIEAAAVGPFDRGDPEYRGPGNSRYVSKVWRADLPWERGLAVPAQAQPARGSAPAPKMVPDWPLTCPKCSRVQSAVLLFNSYDCKHGCYRRGS